MQHHICAGHHGVRDKDNSALSPPQRGTEPSAVNHPGRRIQSAPTVEVESRKEWRTPVLLQDEKIQGVEVPADEGGGHGFCSTLPEEGVHLVF